MGAPGTQAVDLSFSELARPYEDEPALDFVVRASNRRLRVETSVRTWDGDGLGAFLFSLAEDFRGWEGTRTWRSLEHDLSLAAEHHSRGYVHLTWGIHDRAPGEEWCFETTTVHAAGEDMRNLAADVHAFLSGAAGGVTSAGR